MIVVRNLSLFNTRYFYNNREELNTNLWSESSYSLKISRTAKMYNIIHFMEGIISEDYISFDRDDHTLRIEISIPNDLIQFTRCYYSCPITSIKELDAISNEVTYQGMIRFSYNGPEGQSLLWRLSI